MLIKNIRALALEQKASQPIKSKMDGNAFLNKTRLFYQICHRHNKAYQWSLKI